MQVPGILFAVATVWQEAVPMPCVCLPVYVGKDGGQLLLMVPQQASVMSPFSVQCIIWSKLLHLQHSKQSVVFSVRRISVAGLYLSKLDNLYL